MEAHQKKTLAQVVAGCGCVTLLAVSLWMCFVIWVGLQGRGNDEEASMIIGLVTCGCSVPIVLITGVALFFGLRRDEPG